jgi:hypothetical protein
VVVRSSAARRGRAAPCLFGALGFLAALDNVAPARAPVLGSGFAFGGVFFFFADRFFTTEN